MIFDRIARRWRWWRLKHAGAELVYDIQSAAPFFSGEARGLRCGRAAWFSAGTRLIVANNADGRGKLVIGDRLFVNHYAIIDCHYEITIGDDVMIGPHVYIGDFDHNLCTNRGASVERKTVGAAIHIHNHVWIGANAVVLKGVTIGEGAMIGAGAVVTKDIPAMMIAYGVPARPVRLRRAGESI